VPAVCWSTSVFPLIQLGLKPVFVDVEPETFNSVVSKMEKRMNPRVKAVMAVHVLGNSTDMAELEKYVAFLKLVLIEDTCEALDTFYASNEGRKKMLGTCGDFGFTFRTTSPRARAAWSSAKNADDFNLL
jgi:CDP-4-dehydro-6-deoxyglucose reductase, E1